MVQFKIEKRFKDIHTGDIYEVGELQDFTLKRAKEIQSNLSDEHITRVDKTKDKK